MDQRPYIKLSQLPHPSLLPLQINHDLVTSFFQFGIKQHTIGPKGKISLERMRRKTSNTNTSFRLHY